MPDWRNDANDVNATITATPAGDPMAPVVSIRQLRIVFTADDKPGSRTFALRESRVTLGRDETCDVRLGDSECSRMHAEVVTEEGVWLVRDLGSRNGTFVDGRRIESQRIAHGSVVRVGRTLLVVTMCEVPSGQRLDPHPEPLSGASIALQAIRADIALVAPRDLPVLITGPTGVGKELIARAIHDQSGRKGPFVPINCAALPATLAESELFGHVAGAFSGAVKRKEGLFEAAVGGTLFFDELGEMPMDLQPKLLRALGLQEIRPVGGTVATRLDVRIVAATNVDLGPAVESGKFRADLWARLAGWRLQVPALRERRDDVLPIAVRLLARSPGPAALTVDAAEALLLHDWPYNVRELEQVLSVAVVRAQGERAIGIAHLPSELAEPLRARRGTPASSPAEPPLELLVPRDEVPSADALRRVLEHFEGNVASVARFFGKDRRQIYRWAERHRLPLPGRPGDE